MENLKTQRFQALKLDVLLVFIVISLGVGVLFWKVIFLGEALVPGDIPYSTPLWLGEAPHEEYYSAQNYLLSDPINQFYVWHDLAAKSMQSTGKIPLWNPYEFTGQPLVANAQSALFYPPNLLLFWLSPGQVAGIRAILRLFFAGIFMFLFCRELRISRTGALLATIGFTFSGPMIVWLGFPHANVLVCLPFLMWTGEKLLAGTKIFFWGGTMSLGVGLSLLGGHPETTFHVLAVFAVYFILKLGFIKKTVISKKHILVIFSLAIVLGFMVGSIQLLPFADFLFQSSTLASGGRGVGGGLHVYSDSWIPNISTLVTLFYPNFFGNPPSRNYMFPFANSLNYNEQALYFGLIPLMFAIGALFAPKKPKALSIITLLALLCLGVALRFPGFELINHLPIFSLVSNSRLKMQFVFFAAILAGFGFDAFKGYILFGSKKRTSLLYSLTSVPLFTFAIFLVLTIFKNIVLINEFFYPKEQPPVTFFNYLLFNIFALDRVKTMISVIVVLVLAGGYLLLCKRKCSFSAFGYLLITLTLTELVVVAWNYNPTIKDRDILPASQVINVLQEDKQLFRISATDKIMLSNYNVVHHLSHVGGYDLPVFQRFSDLFLGQGGKNDHGQSWEPDWPLLSALNVKYFLSTEKLAFDSFNLNYDGWNVKIYENPDVLPRAYMVYHADVIEDRDSMLKRMIDGRYNFKHRVLLERPLPLKESEEIKILAGGKGNSTVDITRYENDFVEIEVVTEAPGILVMSDLFASGWGATVDDQDVELYRANYTYRAVSVPAGTHTVTFSYHPFSVKLGEIFSILGLVLAVGGGCVLGDRITLWKNNS